MADSRKRTVAKAVSWEVISNAICLLLAYAIFGNIGGCLIFTGVCFGLKLGLFYYHERAWHQTNWGKFTERPEEWNEYLPYYDQ
jgi:adenylylsulfate kinase